MVLIHPGCPWAPAPPDVFPQDTQVIFQPECISWRQRGSCSLRSHWKPHQQSGTSLKGSFKNGGCCKGATGSQAEHRMQKKKKEVIMMRAIFSSGNGKERTYLNCDIRELLDPSITRQRAP